MKHELIFSGIGGQGVLLAGQMLCSAAIGKGYQVTWVPFYGQEKRGGRTMCEIVISHEMGSPIVSAAEILLVMDEKSLEDYEERVTPGGVLIVNDSLVTSKPTRRDIRVKRIPFNGIAKDIGNLKTANMVALGSVLKHFNLVSIDEVKKEIEKVFLAKKPGLVDINIKALEAGYDFRL